MRVVALTIFLLAGPALAQVNERDGAVALVGTFGDWDVRSYGTAEGGRRCAARAIQPRLAEGNVFWVYNTDHRDSLPDGYLTIDGGLFGNAARADVAIQGGGSYPFIPATDGHAYNLPEEAAALLAALRQGRQMTVVLTAADGSEQRFPVSLAGFSRATRAARRECGFAEEPGP